MYVETMMKAPWCEPDRVNSWRQKVSDNNALNPNKLRVRHMQCCKHALVDITVRQNNDTSPQNKLIALHFIKPFPVGTNTIPFSPDLKRVPLSQNFNNPYYCTSSKKSAKNSSTQTKDFLNAPFESIGDIVLAATVV